MEQHIDTTTLRYLVLHGYYQSAEIIKNKLKGFFPKNIHLVIPNAPLKVDNDKYGWFPLDKIDLNKGLVTIDESDISVIMSHDIGLSSTSGPIKFDGIIAFSQGCLAAALLLAKSKIYAPKLLLFSPIPPPDPWIYHVPLRLHCRVYIGNMDDLVAPKHSFKFISVLGNNNIEIIEHRWGHVIPSTQLYKLEYNKFLEHSKV